MINRRFQAKSNKAHQKPNFTIKVCMTLPENQPTLTSLSVREGTDGAPSVVRYASVSLCAFVVD